MSDSFWKNYVFPALFLAVVSVCTLWQFISTGPIPETPNNDLARHAAAITNFKFAFMDSQYLPRMQLLPSSYPDLPVFQFYGSMLGFLSLPFLAMKLPPLISLMFGLLVIRCLGAFALYATGRMLEANCWASLLASASYLLTPYLISNVYGRVAIPEATAHGLIAVLLYGLVRLAIRKDSFSVFIVSLSVVGLSLAHPIFFMFGCAASGLTILITCQTSAILPASLILAGSVLLSSFQWYPAFLLRNDFATNFVNQSPFFVRKFTSFSGLYGFPLSLLQENILPSGSRLFLTPGILTIPILLLLLAKFKNLFARVSFCGAAIFMLLSYSPFDLWYFLPEFVWSVQFPYRLLAFVALFIAVGICVTLQRLRAWQFTVLMILIVGQSFRLLVQPPYSTPLSVAQSDIPSLFASVDYIVVPTAALTSPDGWLRNYALPITESLMDFVVDGEGYLLADNALLLSKARTNENYIRISGSIEGGSTPISLWVGQSNNPDEPLDGTRLVGPGDFSSIFRLPTSLLSLKIRLSDDSARAKIKTVERLPGNEIQVKSSPHERPQFLRLFGTSIFTDRSIDLWIASPESPDLPLTEKATVRPANFVAQLRLPSRPGIYVLVPSNVLVPSSVSNSSDARRLSINLSSYAFVDGDRVEERIPVSSVERIYSHAYRRSFSIRTDRLPPATENASKFLVELPMSFSPLAEISQGGSRIISRASDRGLAMIETSDLLSPFTAQFAMPWPVWPMMIFGVGLIYIGGFNPIWAKRHSRHDSRPAS